MASETAVIFYSTIFLLTLSVLLGLCLLYLIFIYYQLYKLNIPSLHGRYSKVVIYIILLGSTYFLIYTPFSLIIPIYYTNINDGDNKYRYTFSVLATILTQITALIYPFLIVYRSWMVYFKIKWYIAIEDTSWSIFIDSSCKENNFYLKYYDKNKKHSSKIIFISWCILSVPALLFTFLGHQFNSITAIIYGLQYFVPMLTLSILLCKIPKYDDIFMIKTEIKLIIISSIITTICYGPFLVLNTMIPIYGAIILRLYTLIGPFCILYPHLYIPFKKFNFPKTIYSIKHYQHNLEMAQTIESSDSYQDTDKKNKFDFEECLKNPDGFIAFARHLNKDLPLKTSCFWWRYFNLNENLYQ